MTTVCPCPPVVQKKIPFQLSIKAGFPGGPIIGTSAYTNLVLVNALDVNEIFVNNTPETVQALQVVFNSTLGKVSRFQADGVTPNPWQLNDVLIINYAKLYITGNGVTILPNGTPQTILLSGDGTFTLPAGFFITRISIKPTAADTVRIGTTVGGGEIMSDKVMVQNVFTGNGVSLADDAAMADGAPVTIYFTGFTSSAQINIYTLPI
jgi:hypothetical protein